ncbi:MAG: glyceraldehyde 3-phosphate dehydrogenase [Flavobacteriaceae bacterium]|jgi:glyceraldehyde 3-phosphate dehydrogenase
MKKLTVAINGFGRIGRAFYKLSFDRPEIEVVAINDLGDVENLAYLLKYDSAQGTTDWNIEVNEDQTHMTVEGRDVRVYKERDPKMLPWKDLDIDVVVESTGFFNHFEDAAMHLTAGAKKVVLSAPGKGDAVEGIKSSTVLMGINHEELGVCQISSNGSCTTNAGSPIMAIMKESVGVEKAMLNTIHGYTATQSIVDGPSKGDFRKGRAAAQNMIPTSTGAAKAVTQAQPDLVGKFDGIAVRVPVISGSLADITFVSSKDTTAEEVNEILKNAAKDDRWKGIFTTTDEPIVSSDIVGNTHASIADLGMTRVVDGNLVKILTWYDNEMGYTNTLVEHVIETGKSI